MSGQVEETQHCLERERFKMVASLASGVIFDYSIAKDIMLNIVYQDGQNGTEHVMKNYSKTMKEMGVIYEEDFQVFDQFIEEMKKGMEEIYVELRSKAKNHSYQWFSLQGKTIFNQQQEPIRVVGKIVNIHQKKLKEIELYEKTRKDAVTGLYNKQAIKDLINESIQKMDTTKQSGMFVIYIDNFQKINQNLGQVFGDEILRNIGKDLENSFATEDIVGRVSGAEFIIWKQDLEEKVLQEKIKDIHRIFQETYTGDKNLYEISASIGVAYAPKDGASYEVLFYKAEQALYYGKRNGKNSVAVYDKDLEGKYQERRKPMGQEGQTQEAVVEKDVETEESKFDYEIVQFAFQLMHESKDVESAIQLLLRKVGKHYQLGAILIEEKTLELFQLRCMYEWCAKGVASKRNSTRSLTAKAWYAMLEKFEHNDICLFSNRDTCEEEHVTGSDRLREGVKAGMQCAIREDGVFVGSINFVDYEKERVWSKTELNSLKTVSKVISSYLLKMRAYEEASAAVERLTGYDDVTGALKYEKFLVETRRLLRNIPKESQVVLVYSDISNFKYINETYGYHVGNKILKEFVEFITRDGMGSLCCSRVVSDNIVSLVVLNKPLTEKECLEAVIALNEQFTQLQKKKYEDRTISINSGIYCWVDRSIDIAIAVANANLARKKSKRGNVVPRCVLFNEEMDKEIRHQIEFTDSMRQGLENQEFVVYYQPKIESKSQKMVGAEALIRWIRADGSMIFPGEFIPIFERNGLIIQLDYFVYEEVCRYLRERMNKGLSVVPISMNVSRIHLENTKTVEVIRNLMEKYNIPSDLLEFELTENIYVENLSVAVHMVEELKSLGLKVSIDDFGSGYSSLNVLKQLSFDVLKLDKEFLKGFDLKHNDEIVISSIVEMAKKLNVTVLCEGVETEEQVQFLRKIGCDLMQGYYFSKPVDVDSFSHKIEEEKGTME